MLDAAAKSATAAFRVKSAGIIRTCLCQVAGLFADEASSKLVRLLALLLGPTKQKNQEKHLNWNPMFDFSQELQLSFSNPRFP
jgi:hypothetical protein